MQRQGQSIRTVAEEMLVAKARAGKSPGYLKTVRSEIGSAFKGQLRRAINTVSIRDMEQWFFRSELTPRTQRNLARTARTLFAFAERRGYVRNNPAAALELPAIEDKPAEIHTPAQVAHVLQTAQKMNPSLARLLSVQYFAGLRSCEAHKLAEQEIGERYIEVKAEKCKTRRRRLVTVTPTLRTWLDAGGKLPVAQVWTRLAELKARVRGDGVPFGHNTARHTFCSYHLAHFGSAAQTALQAGHSEAMLFAHYRELVTPEAAAAFWGIVPEPSGLPVINS